MVDVPSSALRISSGQCPVLTQNLMDTLKELNQQGKTIVLVTHSNELAAVGTRRLTLDEGRISEAVGRDTRTS